MAKKPTGSMKGFQRTRNDHANETAEDYVEAILRIEEEEGRCRCANLARLFGVSHVTVNKIITRLTNEGLVKTKPYAPVELTAQGRRLAKSARARHEIVFNFLLSLGVDRESASIDAEGIEHHVSPNTLECFRRFAAKEERKNR